jgi:hypothetical protein
LILVFGQKGGTQSFNWKEWVTDYVVKLTTITFLLFSQYQRISTYIADVTGFYIDYPQRSHHWRSEIIINVQKVSKKIKRNHRSSYDRWSFYISSESIIEVQKVPCVLSFSPRFWQTFKINWIEACRQIMFSWSRGIMVQFEVKWAFLFYVFASHF